MTARAPLAEHRPRPRPTGSVALVTPRHILAIAFLAVGAPAARAKPVGSYAVVVSGAGDQTQPSIDAQYVVYASDAAGTWDVLLYEIGAPADRLIRTVAATAAAEDQPDVSNATVAYRTPDGVVVRDLARGATVRSPVDTPSTSRCRAATAFAHPVVTDQLAAWQCDVAGGSAVAVARFGVPVEEYDVARPGAPANGGAQRSPVAHRSLVAFIDGTDGDAVWLHDTAPATRSTTRVCAGRATGVSLGEHASAVVLAVTRAETGRDDDVEIWDASGLVTALRVDGVQRNPHLSGDWVAFEDLSTGRSQVVLWQWTTGLVFLPHASTSHQTLNDLALVAGAEVRAVFAEDANGDLDIALYRVTLQGGTVVDDGLGNPWPWTPPRPQPARCDDPDPTVLATLALGVGKGERFAGHVHFDATPFPGDPHLPVLVCLELERVLSAWVALDDEVVLRPWRLDPRSAHADLALSGGPGARCEDDDGPGGGHVARSAHLEVRTAVDAGRRTLSGVVAGKHGARLVARVLADPGILATAAPAAPAGAASAGPPGTGGCSVAGGLGPLGAALALLALSLRRRR